MSTRTLKILSMVIDKSSSNPFDCDSLLSRNIDEKEQNEEKTMDIENFIANAENEDFVFDDCHFIENNNEFISILNEQNCCNVNNDNQQIITTDDVIIDNDSNCSPTKDRSADEEQNVFTYEDEIEENNNECSYEAEKNGNQNNESMSSSESNAESAIEEQTSLEDKKNGDHSHDNSENSEHNENENHYGKRKRLKRSAMDMNQWSKSKNRRNREQGLSYYGKKKTPDGTWQYNVQKNKKQLRAPCHCQLSRKENCKIKCNLISQDERKRIFESFWRLTWREKKVFVKSLTTVKNTVRRRGVNEGSSRRNTSTEFYLKSGGQPIRVCKKMFLNTLSIGEIAVKQWIRRDFQAIERPKNKESSNEIKNVNNFFDSLPKLESHYCRASSSKLYLEPLWESKAQLYSVYKSEFCKEKDAKPLSRATFSKIFDDKNLSLHHPKKDRCDICIAFETGNLAQDEYDHHVTLKNEARSEKDKDKLSDNEVFTMDLQSVLLSPKSNASALYWKHKLTVHNFTVYDIRRREGYCFLWNESEGGLTSNVFASIIVHFLLKFMDTHTIQDNTEIILYSDGCAYQNRNTVLSNALFNLSKEKNITIVQKFLQKGHTQMEADSMHSTIEKKIRKRQINVPADYIHICKEACKKSPYSVEYLLHPFFKNFDSTNFLSSIRPGKKAGDPVVADLKALKYTSEGVFFKLRHSDVEWIPLPTRISKAKMAVSFSSLPRLYNERLKIKKEKYDNLQQLKRSLTQDYHDFYDNLPYVN